MTTPKKNKGFTLIELMIVVAVIGVLATIAIPAYNKYVTRTKRSDAKVALLALQQAMEKYRANCSQYATGIDATTRTCISGGTHNLVGSTTSPKGYYNVAIVSGSANATTYRIRAWIASGGEQSNDVECTALVINPAVSPSQIAYKSTDGINITATATEDCWK